MIRVVACRLAVLLMVVVGSVPVLAGSAQAHAGLVSAAPAEGAVLASAPQQLRLVFSEEVTPRLTSVRVIGPDGRRVDAGEPQTGDGATVLESLATGGQQGTFAAEWRVTAADDGHTSAGVVTFSVGAPSRNAALGAGGRTDGTADAVLDLAVWLGFAGLAAMVGHAAVRLFCAPGLGAAGGGVGGVGWVVTLVGTLLQLFAYGPATRGESAAHLVDRSLLAATLGSHEGRMLVARILLLALVATVGAPLLRRGGAGARVAATALTLLLALTWAETSHAAGGSLVPLALLATTLHVAAMAVWAGGVGTLALLAVRGGAGQLPAVAGRFSRIASAAVAVLAATGAWQAFREVGSPGALTGTPYGRLLLAKVALLALVLGVAAVVRGRARRPAAGPVARRAVLLELAGVTGLLVLTVLLIGTAPR